MLNQNDRTRMRAAMANIRVCSQIPSGFGTTVMISRTMTNART